MGKRNLIYGVLIAAVVFFAAGCETVPKKFKEEVSGIKSRVETLETKVETVETKQAEVERTTAEQNQALGELKAEQGRGGAANVKTNVSVKEKPAKFKGRTKEIQTCLKNAGFYKGKINGVKTRSTKRAIKEFQKANGLKADGSVGPKTWEALSKYASGAAAQAPAASEEGATK